MFFEAKLNHEDENGIAVDRAEFARSIWGADTKGKITHADFEKVGAPLAPPEPSPAVGDQHALSIRAFASILVSCYRPTVYPPLCVGCACMLTRTVAVA